MAIERVSLAQVIQAANDSAEAQETQLNAELGKLDPASPEWKAMNATVMAQKLQIQEKLDKTIADAMGAAAKNSGDMLEGAVRRIGQ